MSSSINHRHHLAILLAVLSIHNSTPFPTSRPAFIAHAPSIPIQAPSQRRPTHLTAVESPTRPIEDEQEKDKLSNSSSSSRFVPKFLRRKQPSSDQDIIQTIDTLSAYKEEVVNQNDLVVVRFYAPWCKSCKASFPQFSHILQQDHIQ